MNYASADAGAQDVMQVCQNGHVITDLLHNYPERGLLHCDRCGAQTLDHCLTCGQKIPGAIYVPGLAPAGSASPPNYCATCGAGFPWTNRHGLLASNPRAQLETLLRRMPRVIRQLRSRQGERPPFRVEDERDLEDLLRALLPLYFDDIRPEVRTPRYALVKRIDFLLVPQGIVVTTKLTRSELRGPQITEQLQEDMEHYRRQEPCTTLIVFVYDPEGLLREPDALERAWSNRQNNLEVQCVIASP